MKCVRYVEVCSGIRQLVQVRSLHRILSASRLHSSPTKNDVFEPSDVGLGPEIPEYESLNVQMKSYDFAALESYAKFIHNLADRLGVDCDGYAVPPRTCQVQMFKPMSTTVDKEFHLSMFERCIQLQDLPSTVLPVFIETAQTCLPEGVQLTIKEPDEEENEFRFIPDKQLIELQDQLQAIEQAREDRRKK